MAVTSSVIHVASYSPCWRKFVLKFPAISSSDESSRHVQIEADWGFWIQEAVWQAAYAGGQVHHPKIKNTCPTSENFPSACMERHQSRCQWSHKASSQGFLMHGKNLQLYAYALILHQDKCKGSKVQAGLCMREWPDWKHYCLSMGSAGRMSPVHCSVLSHSQKWASAERQLLQRFCWSSLNCSKDHGQAWNGEPPHASSCTHSNKAGDCQLTRALNWQTSLGISWAICMHQPETSVSCHLRSLPALSIISIMWLCPIGINPDAARSGMHMHRSTDCRKPWTTSQYQAWPMMQEMLTGVQP